MNIIDNVVVVDCLHEMFWGIQKGRLLWRVGGGVPRKQTGGGVKLVYAFSLKKLPNFSNTKNNYFW